MSKAKQSCGTCEFANFWRTPNGSIKKGYAADCLYPVKDIPLPNVPDVFEIRIVRTSSIWPENGAECDMYKKRVSE